MALSPLTPEERSAALDKAFRARQERAAAKADLRAGTKTVSEVIAAAEKSEALGKMRVIDLLRAIPGIGERRATAVMKDLGIAESRRIRGLGVHQRAALEARFS